MEEKLVLDKKQQDRIINALLFLRGVEGVDVSFIREIFAVNNTKAENVLNRYMNDFNSLNSGLIVQLKNKIFRYEVSIDVLEKIKTAWNKKKRLQLSGPKLEVLSLVAYKQPVSQSMVSKMRGKESSYVLAWLVKEGFLQKKKPGNARYFQYFTTDYFCNFFKINSPKDLPPFEELQQIEELAVQTEQGEKVVKEESLDLVEIKNDGDNAS